MPKKASDDLSRKGEPSQRTKDGLKIPVPKTGEVFSVLNRAIRKQEPSERSDPEKPRPSQDQ
jgi:hypothetical protein